MSHSLPLLRSSLRVCAALAIMLAFAGTTAAQPAPAPGVIQKKKDEVFSRPEFQPATKEVISDNWLLRQVRNFFEWLSNLSEMSPFLFWSCLIICTIILIVLIGMIGRRVRQAYVGGEKSRKAAADAQRIRLSATYKEESDRRALAGEYTESIRFLFLSLVYRFDERGRVSFHKEYTNREYLDFMTDRLSVRDALELLVDILDEHWYGEHPCTRQQYEACLDVYKRLAG